MIEIERLAARPDVERARRLVYETDAETLDDMVRVTQIPAPSFHEAERGAWVAGRLRELGVGRVETDEAGNVLARLSPESDDVDAALVVAHLDTVFPAGTDLTVRGEGGRLCAPGIADNGRGLAAMLAVARAMVGARVATRRPVVLVASVGEEGAGDLRGVKHLFREGTPWRRAAAVVALDGAGLRRIVHRAVGARRFRCRYTGPGGHSWADWGRANPIHAAGAAIAELGRLVLPRSPRTTLSVGRVGGGTSINAIPEQAWFELDLRSEGVEALAELERRVRAAVVGAARDANRRRTRGTPPIEAELEPIGDRPPGETPAAAAVVRAAREATLFIGLPPELVGSSTDANIPLSLGIPAIALGAGGESGGTHTLDEWYENTDGPRGVERALLTVLGAAEFD